MSKIVENFSREIMGISSHTLWYSSMVGASRCELGVEIKLRAKYRARKGVALYAAFLL